VNPSLLQFKITLSGEAFEQREKFAIKSAAKQSRVARGIQLDDARLDFICWRGYDFVAAYDAFGMARI
jgi:hypothetical protein